MSVQQLKREVELLHRALIVPVEDDTLIMCIGGKKYTYKTVAEGNQALIDFSRNYDVLKNKGDSALIF